MKLKLKLQVHYESELICMLEQYFMLAVCESYSNQTLNLWGGQEKNNLLVSDVHAVPWWTVLSFFKYSSYSRSAKKKMR